MPITITQITTISQVQGEVSKTEHGEEKRSLCRAGCYRIQKCVNASNEGSFTTIFEIKIGGKHFDFATLLWGSAKYSFQRSAHFCRNPLPPPPPIWYGPVYLTPI